MHFLFNKNLVLVKAIGLALLLASGPSQASTTTKVVKAAAKAVAPLMVAETAEQKKARETIERCIREQGKNHKCVVIR